jgi:HK97 family phage major capsid protein
MSNVTGVSSNNATETQKIMAMLRQLDEDTRHEVAEAGQRSSLALEQMEKMQGELDTLRQERNQEAEERKRERELFEREIALLKRGGADVVESPEKRITEQRAAVKAYLSRQRLSAKHSEVLEKLEHEGRALDSLSPNVQADGGILAPVDMRDEIIRYVNNVTSMLEICTVYNTNAGSMTLGSMIRRPDVSWKGIGEVPENTNAVRRFGEIRFVPTSPSEMIYVDEDLISDTDRDIEQIIFTEQANYFSDVLEWAVLQGDGNNEPTGVTQAGLPSVQANTTAGSAFSSDDVVKAAYDMRKQYRRNARYVLSRSGVRHARLLKNNQGDYMWQESLQAGEPDRLNGYPTLESEYFPDHVDNGSAGQPVFVFGDMRQYVIVMRRQFTVKRYDQDITLGRLRKVAYRFDMRAAGKPVQPEAFVVYTRSQ